MWERIAVITRPIVRCTARRAGRRPTKTRSTSVTRNRTGTGGGSVGLGDGEGSAVVGVTGGEEAPTPGSSGGPDSWVARAAAATRAPASARASADTARGEACRRGGRAGGCDTTASGYRRRPGDGRRLGGATAW